MTNATRACAYCDAPLTNPRRVQCGAPECKRQHRNERQREFQAKHRAATGRSYSRRYDRPRTKAYPITCAQCGREATVTKTTSRYCTHQCFYDAKYGQGRPREKYVGIGKAEYQARERAKTRRRRAERRLRASMAGVRGAGVWCAGRCARCGTHFLRKSTTEPTAFCSRRCRQRASASLRRALAAGAEGGFVSRWRIYERDGWLCHICGDPVDRDVVVPAPRAPVLDHVVPIARGGPHCEENLKTAHFYCNSVKRDLVDGWQVVA
ncbi:HNH endonuclease [Streptomyces sp. YIM 121038]|nr:HNH endonuclease [Streptomyces sp. YIM 121038]